MSNTISKLLIANRGEIARRILRSAHAMGMGSVAIYADGDSDAPFVREADQSIALRGRSATETYLCIDKILAAAKLAGADAIHPGYGFLAENATFARAVMEAGLIWVGPSPSAIAAMGDKLSAKKLMGQAGVPQLPCGELSPDSDVNAIAASIGFPLLVKASAGGGGKGMRVVVDPDELEAAVAAARREAASAFGDDTVFLERWLQHARHIEFQVVGDNHGNVVHCFERECSIQRRHQKIIEEAPSCAISPSLRESMAQAAVAAAKAVNYASTGTVEFLVEDDEFWFLEMNTRLQVEHPVTEAITGLDLVREQLRIAQGEALSISQEALSMTGHSIEARLYAEDPANDFLPVTGKLLAWTPSRSAAARFDSGVEAGSTIGIEFDPMLAKVIVHAPTRGEAALRLARVLETTTIQGLVTNREFLVETLRTPEFLAGDTTTDFVQRVGPPTQRTVPNALVDDACVATAMAAQSTTHAASKTLKTLPSGWRNTRMPSEKRCYLHGDRLLEFAYRRLRSGMFDCWLDGKHFQTRILVHDGRTLILEIDDRQLRVELGHVGERWLVHLPNADLELLEQARFPEPQPDVAKGGLTAPMPGAVVTVSVSVGETVEAGQLLLIIEAMKMEHRITARVGGVVTELLVGASQQVANGELLVVVTDEQSA